MSFKYPLLENAFSNQDINSAIKVVRSRRLTMSKKTMEFEKKFSQFIKSNYCLMVNSGSSANLLAFFALINPLKKNKLKVGDECLIPALCWSTSLWPIVQSGLVPKFIDVDLKTFSPNLDIIKKNVTKKTKAIMLINVLGNCSEIDKIKQFARKKKIYLVEDNCESLGSIYKGKNLGTFGDFSSFSFYYSHQLTSGEGGMIVCNNKFDYRILQSLRAHGWDREISKKKNTFNFVNQGFNLRPLDISASIAMSQLKRLKKMIKIRKYNRDMIIKYLKKSPKWDDQFTFFESSKHLKPSWFSIPLLINKKYLKYKKFFLEKLEKNKIETRPIISGNFINQPAIKLHKFKFKKKNFRNSQAIEDRGFFIGLPTKKIKLQDIKRLTNYLLDF
tara:strand:- start:1420 stop:2583 length:1164 start_codon:yes stop_codon:yes gene_type:complete